MTYTTARSLSRLACLIFSACIQLGILSPLLAKAVNRCYMCGMDAAKSQTEFVVYFDDGAEEHTCCLHCVYLLQQVAHDRKISGLKTRDFSKGAFIEAKEACYLEGSALLPKGSMAPFLLAFLEKDAAEKYKKKYGGNVVGFTEAMAIVADFDKKVSPKITK